MEYEESVLMITFFLYLGVMAVFIFIGICINELHTECVRRKRIKAIVRDQWSWCSQNCLTYEMCDSNHKDPDDVWKELEDYCSRCPLMANIEMWEERKR